MSTNNFGFQTFVNQINQSLSYLPSSNQIGNLARVTHVVYGPTIPGSNIPDVYYSGPTSLGTITYQLFGANQDRTFQAAGNPPAKPLYSSIKKFPVVGEIVQIVVGAGIMNEDKEQIEYYYTAPIGIWGTAHHNAFPDSGDYSAFVNKQVQTYQQNQFSKTPDNPDSKAPVNMPLGPGFVEKKDIKTLRNFPGDVIIEGRWGNSIRFGSTTAVLQNENYWSNNSTPGNPITIIRNGQGAQLDKEGFVPTVENINEDPSSIYLTQGQQIIIDDIQRNFKLETLGVSFQNSITTAVPLQSNLTSYDSISPAQQDNFVAQTT